MKRSGRALAIWVAVRVLVIAAVFEVLYLVAGNIALCAGLPSKLAATSKDLKLTYGSAWTFWPGKVHASDLTLRAKDHNVEFLVAVDTVTVNIALSDLFVKRFHATSLETTGTVWKMRHHVASVGDKGLRLAAYPSIEGFPDPPLFPPETPPPLTDENYNLWEIELENVNAEIAEVWELEYRYQGPGTATGRFHLRPARWFEVGPAKLELRGGRLTVGDVAVAERMTGTIDCFAAHTNVQGVEGLAVMRDVSAGIHLALEQGDLSFANVYTRPLLDARVSGKLSGRIDVTMKQAVLAPGGRVTLDMRPLELMRGKAHFGGPVTFELAVGPEGAPDGFVVSVRSPELIGAIRDKETPSPSAHGVHASATVGTRDIRKDIQIVGKALEVRRLDAPSLAWFQPLWDGGPELRGSAVLHLRGEQDEKRGVSADVKGSFERLRVGLGETTFRSETGDLEAALRSVPKSSGHFDVKGFAVNVAGLSMSKGKDATPPLTAKVRGDSIEIDDMSPFTAHGVLRAHGDRADALLPLLIEPAFLRSVASTALQLDSVEARVAFQLGPKKQTVEVLDVRSGKLQAKGVWQKTKRGKPEGRFLVSAGDLNLSVKLDDTKTDVKPFASSDWLPEELRKLSALTGP